MSLSPCHYIINNIDMKEITYKYWKKITAHINLSSSFYCQFPATFTETLIIISLVKTLLLKSLKSYLHIFTGDVILNVFKLMLKKKK